MKRLVHFGLLALVPAALNTSSMAIGEAGLLVPICTGDGQVHYARLPAGPKRSGGDEGTCCAKACHSGSRKRVAGSGQNGDEDGCCEN